MTYNPPVKVYYKTEKYPTIGDSNRLVPAPLLDVQYEPLYANDVIIGYTYVVNLTGYATSLDRRLSESSETLDIKNSLQSVDDIRDILYNNAGTLIITFNGIESFKLIGGSIRSASFEEGPSNWYNYVPYSVQIEFNELELSDCDSAATPVCGDIFDGLTDTPQLLDMKKYRVKSISDTFTLDIQEASLHNDVETFNITYSISAQGKHYYNESQQLLPAWEQAKNFVQDTLRKRINDQLTANTIFKSYINDGCSTGDLLSSLYGAGNGGGLLGGLGTPFNNPYRIYNETIECSSSESDGSFSANYQALIKRVKSLSGSDAYIHTHTKTTGYSREGEKKNTTINYSGSIQGLIDTRIFSNQNNIYLPNNGTFIAGGGAAKSKYDNALMGYAGGVTIDAPSYADLGISIDEDCLDQSKPPPADSSSITHDTVNGIITYEYSYSTDGACQNGLKPAASGSGAPTWSSFNVSFDDATDIIAEFIVPGRENGPIIQKIGAKTPKRVTIEIQGASQALSETLCCPPSGSGSGNYGIDCNGTPTLPSGIVIPNPTLPGMKLIQDNISINPIDGSYSVSKTYTECC